MSKPTEILKVVDMDIQQLHLNARHIRLKLANPAIPATYLHLIAQELVNIDSILSKYGYPIFEEWHKL